MEQENRTMYRIVFFIFQFAIATTLLVLILNYCFKIIIEDDIMYPTGLYAYIDVKFNPQKYSFNCYMAKSLIKDEEERKQNNSKTVIGQMDKLYNEHKGQVNIKSRIIVKYLNQFYDFYQAILSDNFENIKPIVIDKEDEKLLRIMEYDFESLNIFIPPLEEKEILAEEVNKRNEIRKQIQKRFKRNVRFGKIKFANLLYKDRYFTDFSDYNGKKGDMLWRNAEIEAKKDRKFIKESENLDGVTAKRIMFYKILLEIFGNQYIAEDTRGDLYRIKQAVGGNKQHWEIVKVDLYEEDRLNRMEELEEHFNRSIEHTAKMLQRAEKRLDGIMY